MLSKIFWVSLILVFSGCVQQLEKYQQGGASMSLAPTAQGSRDATKASARVQKLRDKVYVVVASQDRTMSALVETLMENYNITLLDRGNGVLTTEWDTFYMGDRVYRNKVSVLVKGQGWGKSQLKISNNVEVLSATGLSAGKIWLPANDKGAEEKRITLLLEEVLNNRTLPNKKPVAG